MTETTECILKAMAGRVCTEVDMAIHYKEAPSKAMEHLETAQQALAALRYRLFQETHTSGTRG